MAITAILPDQVLANGANDGDVLTVQAGGLVAFEAPAGGGIGGSTGSTDNAILRADGTGGSTVQSSSPVIDDSGNMGVGYGNYLCWSQSAGAPNTGFSLRSSGVYSVLRTYYNDVMGFSHYGYVSLGNGAGYSFSSSSSVASHPSNGIYRTDDNNIRASTFVASTAPSCGLQVTHLQAYNTYTSSTSYERLDVDWNANVCTIQTTAGSAGGTKRGLQIGGASTDELGFFGATPVDQPATVADPSGGSTVDTEARAAIAAVIDRLQELGLIA
jgi:hypothetical protein